MVSKNAVKTGKSIEMREALKDINKFLKIQRDSVASLAK
jgi:hypothetical protein